MKYPRKVYAIRHNTTNKVYIGSSCNVDRRFLQHLYGLRSHKHPVQDMQKDFDEYGEDFTLTVLDTINDSSEDCKEYKWMDKYQSFVQGTGYNYQDMKVRQRGKEAAEEKPLETEYEELTEYDRLMLKHMRKLKDNPTAFMGIAFILAAVLPPDEPPCNTDDPPCNTDEPDDIA